MSKKEKIVTGLLVGAVVSASLTPTVEHPVQQPATIVSSESLTNISDVFIIEPEFINFDYINSDFIISFNINDEEEVVEMIEEPIIEEPIEIAKIQYDKPKLMLEIEKEVPEEKEEVVELIIETTPEVTEEVVFEIIPSEESLVEENATEEIIEETPTEVPSPEEVIPDENLLAESSIPEESILESTPEEIIDTVTESVQVIELSSPAPEQKVVSISLDTMNDVIPLSETELNVLIEVCKNENIPIQYALGIIDSESNFNPNARNSSSGCYGYCQLHPKVFSTGLSPEENIRAGITYLAECYHQGGDNWMKAYNIYNRGHYTGDTSYPKAVLREANKWETTLTEAGFTY